MLLFLLIGGFVFCATGFIWNFWLLKYETEHRNARGFIRFTRYNGIQLHENYKTMASLSRTVGILLLITGGFVYMARFVS